MRLRLLEIELGVVNPQKSRDFYQQALGMAPAVDQEHLKVFNLANNQIDFNISTHFKPKETCITFLTDNLDEMMLKLKHESILFEGPSMSHLGMLTIVFKDPDGYLIKVNQATDESPEWLRLI